MLVQIQDLADQSGIDFLSVTPGDATEAAGFQIIPLQLEFTGSYFDLSDFAYRVEQLVRGAGKASYREVRPAEAWRLRPIRPPRKSSEATTESPDLTVSMTLYAFCMDQAAAADGIVGRAGISGPGELPTAPSAPPASK